MTLETVDEQGQQAQLRGADVERNGRVDGVGVGHVPLLMRPSLLLAVSGCKWLSYGDLNGHGLSEWGTADFIGLGS